VIDIVSVEQSRKEPHPFQLVWRQELLHLYNTALAVRIAPP
jgi:hypothetical protein